MRSDAGLRAKTLLLGCCAVAAFAGSAAFAKSDKVLHRFADDGTDGTHPVAPLVQVNGVFYGTTYNGGGGGEAGTVFSLSNGVETVLHSFGSGGDGAGPAAGLTPVGGVLYGTTETGGANGAGTVYSVTPGGTEQVVYSFRDTPDGAAPASGLLFSGGLLYGTTSEGGNGTGTVFSVAPGGGETVLYAFAGGTDGAYPAGGLVSVNGTLYGATSEGGKYGGGTVFSITPGGQYSVLYSFGASAADGINPGGDLLVVGNSLFGTTAGGGANGFGTVYSVTKGGAEQVLYSFQGSGAGDGAYPEAGLVAIGSTLFGTTYGGGRACTAPSGCGTVFSVSRTGAEKVLYAFKGGKDGAAPYAAPIAVGKVLYGTTEQGGGTRSNTGTVFSIKK